MAQTLRTQPIASYDDAPDPASMTLSAAAVVDRIWDTARWKPLVLVSCVLDDRPKVGLDRLSSAIGDAAEILVITASEAWSLQRRVPRGFEAYGGAIRVVLPDATEDDPSERHPLFFTFDNDNPADTVSRISSCLTRNGFTRTKSEQSSKPAATPRQQRRAILDPHEVEIAATAFLERRLDLGPRTPVRDETVIGINGELGRVGDHRPRQRPAQTSQRNCNLLHGTLLGGARDKERQCRAILPSAGSSRFRFNGFAQRLSSHGPAAHRNTPRSPEN